MILALKTDAPEAQVYLIEATGEIVESLAWQAHRNLANDLLGVVRDLLAKHEKNWSDISGIVLFKGPGSFTGLRIAAAMANTIAHTSKVPIVGTTGESWLHDGLDRLHNNEDDKIVLPHYGSEAHITKPKK